MTIAKAFYCPRCEERVFHLKFQMDDSINWRPWPFSIECDNCGAIIDGRLQMKVRHDKSSSPTGIPDLEIIPKLKSADYNDDGAVFAYSNTLPVPEYLYYQPWKGPGISSVFLVVSSMVDSDIVVAYGRQMAQLERDVIRYDSSLNSLSQLLRGSRTNIKAFKKTLQDKLGLTPKETPSINSWTECYDIYQELHRTVLKMLNRGDNSVLPLFKFLITGLVNLGQDKVNECRQALMEILDEKFSNYSKKLYIRLDQCVQELWKLLPGLFVDIYDSQNLQLDKQLRLVTSSLDDVENLFRDNFNFLARYMPFIMGIYNLIANGTLNKFFDKEGNELKYNLIDFLKCPDGKRIELMSTIPILQTALSEAMNHHIRNGIDHEDSEYDLSTQLCTYYYERQGEKKSEQCYLIRLAHMCVMQIRWLANLSWEMRILEIGTIPTEN